MLALTRDEWKPSRTRGTAAAGTAAPTAGTAAGAGQLGGHGVQLDRVFIIVLENHSLNSVIGDPNAPYITSLARQYREATNYYGVTHPSEPNYAAIISGSDWWINNDNPANRFDHTNLVDELTAAHIPWGAYLQAVPAGDPLADYWPSASNPLYASKAGCCDSPVLPAGDPDINAAWPGGLYGGGLVPAVAIDPSGPAHYVSNTSYNHYSLLRTIEDAWHLPELAFSSDHTQVQTMNEFLGPLRSGHPCQAAHRTDAISRIMAATLTGPPGRCCRAGASFPVSASITSASASAVPHKYA